MTQILPFFKRKKGGSHGKNILLPPVIKAIKSIFLSPQLFITLFDIFDFHTNSRIHNNLIKSL